MRRPDGKGASPHGLGCWLGANPGSGPEPDPVRPPGAAAAAGAIRRPPPLPSPPFGLEILDDVLEIGHLLGKSLQ
jgi:hypothetical protein